MAWRQQRLAACELQSSARLVMMRRFGRPNVLADASAFASAPNTVPALEHVRSVAQAHVSCRSCQQLQRLGRRFGYRHCANDRARSRVARAALPMLAASSLLLLSSSGWIALAAQALAAPNLPVRRRLSTVSGGTVHNVPAMSVCRHAHGHGWSATPQMRLVPSTHSPDAALHAHPGDRKALHAYPGDEC